MGGSTETEKMKRHVEQCDQCKIAHLASNGIAYSEYCDTYAEMFENVIDFECGDDIGYWLTEKMVAKLVDPYSKAREAEVVSIFRDDSGKRIEVATLARVIRRVQ
jgi:hypothetical protein